MPYAGNKPVLQILAQGGQLYSFSSCFGTGKEDEGRHAQSPLRKTLPFGVRVQGDFSENLKNHVKI